MAVLKMKCLEIIALQQNAKEIVDLLQLRGVVEITKQKVKEDESPLTALSHFSNQGSVVQFEKSLQLANQALAILDRYSAFKKSIVDGFAGRQELSEKEYEAMASRIEEISKKARLITNLSQKIDAAETAITHTKALVENLLPWEELDIPMQYSGSTYTAAFVGTLPSLYSPESLAEALEIQAKSQGDDAGDAVLPPLFIQVVYASREQSCVVVFCHRTAELQVKKLLRDIGFVWPTDPTKHPPSHRLNRLRQKIENAEKEIDSLSDEIQSMANLRQDLLFMADYYLLRRDKYSALGDLQFSQKTFILQGFIPERDVAALEKELTQNFTLSMVVSDPSEEVEVPVSLHNNLLAYPLEDITEAYSLPSKNDIDPNFVMAFFYYLFFGLMLSDAGYGILMVLATGLILKFKKPEGKSRQNLLKFLFCGASTILWGALFGSWFGNLVYTISFTFFGQDIQLKPLWFDPVNDPLKLLIFSIILGFIHVMVGMIIKFRQLWKYDSKAAAIFDIGFWWVIFLGLGVILAAGMISTTIPLQQIGTYTALAGAIGLVLTQGRASKKLAGKILGGVASLYSVTGYFSDLLSYSRLMALGLVTGIIGTVVNTIGAIAGNSLVGIIVFIAVFLVGHAINLGINLLGAYVHGNRLQYVEFFSKFYEGGGRAFRPFGVHTNHFKFKEDK